MFFEKVSYNYERTVRDQPNHVTAVIYCPQQLEKKLLSLGIFRPVAFYALIFLPHVTMETAFFVIFSKFSMSSVLHPFMMSPALIDIF